MKIKDMLTSTSITNTEKMLTHYNLVLDKYDGVISLEDKDFSSKLNNELTIHYRLVVNSFSYNNRNNRIIFEYSTTKDSYILKKEYSHRSPEEWFEIFERAASVLCLELGLTEIEVMSGRKDKTFLEGKGFTKREHFFYHKKIVKTIGTLMEEIKIPPM